MIGIFIAIAVLLGAGGTATVADSARPGDALFGIDQAVEKLRINIAQKENKNELRIKFAEERVKEIEALVQDDSADDTPPSAEVADSDEDDSVSAKKQTNVSTGIEAALNLLAGLQEQQGANPRLDDIISRLNAYISDLPSSARIEVDDDKLEIKFEDDESDEGEDDESDDDDSNKSEIKNESKDGESKIKIRTDEGRIKIEVKNGVLEIKTKLDEKTDGLEEVEAEILSDKTIVKVELNDEETTFTTTATTRAAIIAAVVAKFPSLTAAQVDAMLEIETDDDDQDKDDDSDEDEESDKDEDESDDDKDDDSDDKDDESNSGTGSN